MDAISPLKSFLKLYFNGKMNKTFLGWWIFFFLFSIENLIANISFYALSWPKLNFGCYFTFEIIFKLYFNGKTNIKILVCWIFLPAINATVFTYIIGQPFKSELILMHKWEEGILLLLLSWCLFSSIYCSLAHKIFVFSVRFSV